MEEAINQRKLSLEKKTSRLCKLHKPNNSSRLSNNSSRHSIKANGKELIPSTVLGLSSHNSNSCPLHKALLIKVTPITTDSKLLVTKAAVKGVSNNNERIFPSSIDVPFGCLQ